MQRIIINADDLGVSLHVNRAIEECIRKGEITSSTIIASGDAFDDAVRVAKMYPNVSFGVHLTLDEYQSLTQSPVLHKYGITDAAGVFVKDGYKNVDTYTKELRDAVCNEWKTQIQKIKDAGIAISHLDGHHHCHTHPKLKNVLFSVLKEEGIKKVRLPQTRTLKMRLNGIRRPVVENGKYVVYRNRPKNIVQYAKAFLGTIIEWWQLVWYKRHFVTTDFFCAASFYQANKEYLKIHYPDIFIELMSHPGHPDYLIETKNLKDMCKREVLINFNQI